MSFFIFAAAAIALSYCATSLFLKYALHKKIMDIPGSRSSHRAPTPRGGGVGFVAVWSMVAAALIFFEGSSIVSISALLIGALVVASIGFIDDHIEVVSWKRFFVHMLAAVFFIVMLDGWPTLDFGAGKVGWGSAGVFIAVLSIVWSINLYNFMDGIDTIASLEAIFIFVAGGAMVWLSGGRTEGLLALMLAAAVGGFMIWNLPPARIFMGDVGSGFLGFLVASFALLGERKYGVPVLLWVILYGVFLFDATATLFRRIIRGEKWHKPHRSHAYQRLHQAGWSHGQVVAGAGCLNAVLCIFAFAAFLYPSFILSALFLSLILLTTIYLLVEHRNPMKKAG